MPIYAVQLTLAFLLTPSSYSDELPEMRAMDYPLLPSTLSPPEAAMMYPMESRALEIGRSLVAPRPYDISSPKSAFSHKGIFSPRKQAGQMVTMDVADKPRERIFASDYDNQETSSNFKTSSSASCGVVATAVPIITQTTRMANTEPPPRSGYIPASTRPTELSINSPYGNPVASDLDNLTSPAHKQQQPGSENECKSLAQPVAPPVAVPMQAISSPVVAAPWWMAPSPEVRSSQFSPGFESPAKQDVPPHANPLNTGWRATPTAPSFRNLAHSVDYTSSITPGEYAACVTPSRRNNDGENGSQVTVATPYVPRLAEGYRQSLIIAGLHLPTRAAPQGTKLQIPLSSLISLLSPVLPLSCLLSYLSPLSSLLSHLSPLLSPLSSPLSLQSLTLATTTRSPLGCSPLESPSPPTPLLQEFLPSTHNRVEPCPPPPFHNSTHLVL
jgi:hypothetical protein